MSEVIVVTSGKGGVGKTTTSANVGAGLAAMGKKVVLIDTDIGLRNLDVVMGLENRIVYNLVDVIEGKCRVKQALIKDKRHQSLYLMPSAQTKDKSAVNPQQMVKMVQQLKEQFDYIILDCPAGIEQGFKNAIAAADQQQPSLAALVGLQGDGGQGLPHLLFGGEAGLGLDGSQQGFGNAHRADRHLAAEFHGRVGAVGGLLHGKGHRCLGPKGSLRSPC